MLQPSVQFLLTFSNLPASAVSDPKGLQTLVANDLQVSSTQKFSALMSPEILVMTMLKHMRNCTVSAD